MSATKKPTGVKAKLPKREAPDDVPQFFRLNVEVGDLDAATSFYENLLGVQGRKQRGTDATSSVAGLRCKYWITTVRLKIEQNQLVGVLD
jgi:hypothetical protein